MVTGRSRPTVGTVQPSSLIFLVIVAIWAAYLVQHWVRRREHVATARSVDRFSEAMRVLERRSPLPSSELSAPRPHSYAVKPASSRPAVTVKRAVAAQAEPRGARVTARVTDRHESRSPLAARSASGSTTGGSVSSRSVAARVHGFDGDQTNGALPNGGRPNGALPNGARPAGARHVAGRSIMGRLAAGRLGPGRLGADRPAAGRPSRSASAVLLRKVRGVSFLLTLAAIPVTVALSALHVLLWASVALSGLAFAVVVVWLRTSVMREQAARAATSRSWGPAGRASWSSAGPASPKAQARARARTAPAQTPVAEPTAASAHLAREVVAAGVFDVNAPLTTDEVAVAVDLQVSGEAGVPGGWSPVPVPPPTYTLKATASRPRPEPAEVTQTPVPIEVEDDDIERMAAEHHHRRVVGG